MFIVVNDHCHKMYKNIFLWFTLLLVWVRYLEWVHSLVLLQSNILNLLKVVAYCFMTKIDCNEYRRTIYWDNGQSRVTTVLMMGKYFLIAIVTLSMSDGWLS